jgi:hypothetical protein
MPISLAHSSTSLRPARIPARKGVLVTSARQEEHSMAGQTVLGVALPDPNGDGAWHFGSETYVYVCRAGRHPRSQIDADIDP